MELCRVSKSVWVVWLRSQIKRKWFFEAVFVTYRQAEKYVRDIQQEGRSFKIMRYTRG